MTSTSAGRVSPWTLGRDKQTGPRAGGGGGVNDNQALFSSIAQKGQHAFTASPPKEAFDVWWSKEFGTRMRGSKYIARRAWYAALREMGCNDDRPTPTPRRCGSAGTKQRMGSPTRRKDGGDERYKGQSV
jgi:hypothetical protein